MFTQANIFKLLRLLNNKDYYNMQQIDKPADL